MSEAPSKLRQMKDRVQVQRQCNQRLSAVAVLLRLMEIRGKFEGNRSLSCERSCPANIFILDRSSLRAVEHAEHSQQFAR